MNKCVLLGRITKDPDLTFTAGKGTAVCKFSIAVKRQFKKDEVDFINCVCFGKTAETISQYFVKGNQICVDGSIQTGSYEAKDGSKRYTTDILVNSFVFIDGAKGGNSNVAGSIDTNIGLDNDMVEDDMGEIPF